MVIDGTGFGVRLAQLRIAAGYRSIAEFAAAIGVSKSLVSDLETGRRLPEQSATGTMERIAAGVRVPLDTLLHGEATPAPQPLPAIPPTYGRPAVPADGLSPADAQQLLDMVNEYIRTHRR